jgi:hypothetical protein
MKRLIHILSLSFFSCCVFSQASSNPATETQWETPRFQLSAGLVASSIDLSRYVNYELCRGLHAGIVTRIKGSFFISTEYSGFPVHAAPVAWDDIHTHKIDVNAHFSFAMTESSAHIYGLLGIDRHEWTGRFTGLINLDQFANGLQKGTYASVKRWGVNAGIGFTQLLYENIGITGDFRFNFSTPNGDIHFHPQAGGPKNEFGILDVMTTFGITYDIPQLPKSKKTKTFGIGKKMYKWTHNGGK